jgi:signal transduction histidine kinase
MRTRDDRPDRTGTPSPAPAPPGGGHRTVRVYPPPLRWAVAATAAVVGVTGTVVAGFLDGTDATYLLAHAVTAVPYLACSAACTWGALQAGPPDYRPFWRPWLGATVLGLLGAVAAIVGVVGHMRAFVVLDGALLLASCPLWAVATLRMLRLHAGRLSMSIDVVDGLTALLVLGVPWLLVVAEPLTRADELIFAVPFAAVTVLAPAGLYLAFVELSRVPRGDRAPQAIGLALGTAFTVSITMQLAQVVANVDLPLAAFIGLHCLVLGLALAVPLWAPTESGSVTARLARPATRHSGPMPAVAAVVLPVLGAYAFAARGHRPWGVPFVGVVVLLVVVLNAVRHAALTHEARRLQAGLAEAAEERGRLLAAMLRALEDDRHRTATELHAQAVGSLTTLGTIIQTAAVTLPPSTAAAVTETVAGLQGDLTDRAEQLRQLMVAMRSPAFAGAGSRAAGNGGAAGRASGGEATLGAALRAYAAELVRDGAGPAVTVEVEPGLHLDWSTMTIAYRVAQEALANAARHARATQVAVTVQAAGCGISVEVRDDGRGFEPGEADAGSGLATMALFADLGRGELAVDSAPGEGTTVRCLVGTRRAAPGPAGPPGATAASGPRGAGGAREAASPGPSPVRPRLHVVGDRSPP